nr:H/ACA ribonucleoprotein complex subunit 1-like [Penaeus vannamei]
MTVASGDEGDEGVYKEADGGYGGHHGGFGRGHGGFRGGHGGFGGFRGGHGGFGVLGGGRGRGFHAGFGGHLAHAAPVFSLLNAFLILCDNEILVFSEGPAHYSYEYAVNDDYAGTNFGHKEVREGYQTKGSYFVHLPDGRLQTVNYIADEHGFRPEVSFEGVAHHAVPVRPHAKAAHVKGGYH